MIQIRPVSDLRNKFPEVESMVKEGSPVYLTKNGYGSMVLLSLELYSRLVGETEKRLDEADEQAQGSDVRYSHDEVFSKVRGHVHE